jgi:uncharacterized coiled-coil DUF342 family protein
MLRQKQARSRGYLGALLTLAVCIGLAVFLFFNRQYIVDQVTVWQFTPSSEVAAITNRAMLSDTGKFYFYAAQPRMEEAETFNVQCDHKEAGAAILGCYTGRFIYIYNVQNTKLDGIREVTAAHEMLHVAYDRLSIEEKKEIGVLLEVEYEVVKNNADLAERMAFYDRTEPGERQNELHSIIATEVAAISPKLEAHYSKYFTNRAAIVELYKKYAGVFEDLKKRSDQLSAQLTQLGDTIETSTARYNADVAQLNKDIEAFNAKVSAGGFQANAQFQNERASLIKRASSLEAKREGVNATIAEYNRLRDELASIASESEALNRSINSSLQPAPQL